MEHAIPMPNISKLTESILKGIYHYFINHICSLMNKYVHNRTACYDSKSFLLDRVGVSELSHKPSVY